MSKRLIGAFVLAAVAIPAAAFAGPRGQNFGAHMNGRKETTPVDTPAQGQATFHLSDDGESLDYRLIVSNIENVTASHIHLGGPTVNGPVVAFLAGNFPPAGGRTDGVLAEGTITEANLVGSLAGQDLDALLRHMRAGNTYVNVHTSDGVSDAPGPAGDFPAGEIRGQIEPRGPNR